MASGSIGAITAGLGECLQQLESVQTSLGEVREMVEDLLAACLDLGIEGTATRVEELLAQVDRLADRVGQVTTHTVGIIVQAQAIGGGGSASVDAGGSGGTVQSKGTARHEGLTYPSRSPDALAVPRGVPARIGPKDDADTARGRRRENEGAQALARLGYDVEQNPAVPGVKKPDYRIEGKIFDAHAPQTSRARNIAGTIRGKVEEEKTFRLLVHLDDSAVAIDDLREQLQAWPIPRLEEVLVLKAGQITRLFP